MIRNTSAGLMLLTSLCAHAQMNKDVSSSETVWSAGVGVVSGPAAPGSAKTKNRAIPFVAARFANGVFFDPLRGLGLERQLGANLSGSLSLGADFSSRKPDDEPRLRGLEKVSEAFAARASLSYRFDRLAFDTRLAVRLGNERKRGTAITEDVSYALTAGAWGALRAGVTMTAADYRWLRNFYGVTPGESAASGFSAFRPSAGLVSTGVFGQAVYKPAQNWTVLGRAGVNTLQGDARRSPIVAERNQPYLFVTVTREF